MTRRRPPNPSPRTDWRALAGDTPQARLPLATAAEPSRDPPTEPVTAALEIQHRTDEHGRRIAIVTGIGQGAVAHALDLRRWAEQLAEAADEIEGGGSRADTGR